MKANICNTYFTSQCTTIACSNTLTSFLNYMFDDKLRSFSNSSEVIFQLIKSLDPNKAHGQDEISVKMEKQCVHSLNKPITLILEKMLGKSNIAPFPYKKDKQLIKSY